MNVIKHLLLTTTMVFVTANFAATITCHFHTQERNETTWVKMRETLECETSDRAENGDGIALVQTQGFTIELTCLSDENQNLKISSNGKEFVYKMGIPLVGRNSPVVLYKPSEKLDGWLKTLRVECHRKQP